MKKTFIVIVCLFVSCGLFIPFVNAEYNGGGTDGSSSGVGGTWCQYPGLYYSWNNDTSTRAYYLRVIYSNGKDANWEFIGKPLVIVKDSSDTRYHHRDALSKFADANGAKLVYGADNTLVQKIATELANSEKGQSTAGRIRDYLDANNYANAQTLLGLMNAADSSDYVHEHYAAAADGSSYGKPGYRLIVEKVVLYQQCARNQRSGLVYATTRKFLANTISKSAVADQMGTWTVSGANRGYHGEIHTTFNDINVQVSGYSYENFKSYNKGAGLNIYDLGIFVEFEDPGDFTIDAACTNCDSASNDNTAFVIQDTSDWGALQSVTRVDDEAVSGYFTEQRVVGYVCREEYHIKYPNANNVVEVATGKYFTVNEDVNNTSFPAGTPNFGPIEATMIAQCSVTDEEATINPAEVSNYYSDDGHSLVRMYLRYFENADNFEDINDERYDITNEEELVTWSDNASTSLSGGIVTFQRTTKYKLPSDIYRYMKIGSGKAVIGSAFSSATYTDMGGPTLPISFNNKRPTSGTGVAAEVTLSFRLPSDSNMNDAFTADNSFLKTDSTKNMYKDNDTENLKNSACAKLYGYGTSDFYTCASKRTENKIGSGSDNCFERITNNDYTCPVYFEGDDDDDDSNDCRIETNNGVNTYYNDNNQKITYETYHTVTKSNGGCCDPNKQICDRDNGCRKELVGDSYYYYNDSNQRIDWRAYYFTSKANGGCCVGDRCDSGDSSLDSDIPIPGDLEPCANNKGEGPGGVCVIYRPIDLTVPFPGMLGIGRDTGANWCYRDMTKAIPTCSSDYRVNKVVDKHIQNNRTYETEDIYTDESPMYTFVLNANTIKEIRSYNESTNYDDFNMSCNDEGFCFSKFIHESGVVNNYGECNKLNWSTCAERK